MFPSRESNFIFLMYVFLWFIKYWDSWEFKRRNTFHLQCFKTLYEQKVVPKYTSLCILASLLPAHTSFRKLLLWFYPLQVRNKVGSVCMSQLLILFLLALKQIANLGKTFSLPFFPLCLPWQGTLARFLGCFFLFYFIPRQPPSLPLFVPAKKQAESFILFTFYLFSVL